MVELPGLATTPPGIICECVKVAQSCLTLCDLMNCSPAVSSVHGILQTRILEWVPFPSPGDLFDPWIESRSLALQDDSLPSESPRGGGVICGWK